MNRGCQTSAVRGGLCVWVGGGEVGFWPVSKPSRGGGRACRAREVSRVGYLFGFVHQSTVCRCNTWLAPDLPLANFTDQKLTNDRIWT